MSCPVLCFFCLSEITHVRYTHSDGQRVLQLYNPIAHSSPINMFNTSLLWSLFDVVSSPNIPYIFWGNTPQRTLPSGFTSNKFCPSYGDTKPTSYSEPPAHRTVFYHRPFGSAAVLPVAKLLRKKNGFCMFLPNVAVSANHLGPASYSGTCFLKNARDCCKTSDHIAGFPAW